jgi:hypothetical protein
VSFAQEIIHRTSCGGGRALHLRRQGGSARRRRLQNVRQAINAFSMLNACRIRYVESVVKAPDSAG